MTVLQVLIAAMMTQQQTKAQHGWIDSECTEEQAPGETLRAGPSTARRVMRCLVEARVPGCIRDLESRGRGTKKRRGQPISMGNLNPGDELYSSNTGGGVTVDQRMVQVARVQDRMQEGTSMHKCCDLGWGPDRTPDNRWRGCLTDLADSPQTTGRNTLQFIIRGISSVENGLGGLLATPPFRHKLPDSGSKPWAEGWVVVLFIDRQHIGVDRQCALISGEEVVPGHQQQELTPPPPAALPTPKSDRTGDPPVVREQKLDRTPSLAKRAFRPCFDRMRTGIHGGQR
ncbi:hypothetical protein C8Q80DRAFT_1121266 [Daedaleopsis nitida]|nr:hypothetical protein C8Q80DRAFT_1121266 [Daedaleopsis nitida]